MIALLASPVSNYTYGYINTVTTLYSDAQCSDAVTTLPATYFVILLETREDCYKVSYKDIAGYVKDIEPVDYEPVTKYAAASFTANNDGYPVKLREEPSPNAKVLTQVPDSESGYYYGDINGTALIPQVGNKWHYVNYNDGRQTYYGYVYSSQVTVTPIRNNVIEKVTYEKDEEFTSSPSFGTEFIIIICLTVPSVLIMYLVFKDKKPQPRYKE